MNRSRFTFALVLMESVFSFYVNHIQLSRSTRLADAFQLRITSHCVLVCFRVEHFFRTILHNFPRRRADTKRTVQQEHNRSIARLRVRADSYEATGVTHGMIEVHPGYYEAPCFSSCIPRPTTDFL